MARKVTLDPQSADVVLVYTGSGDASPSFPGVPARDLSANDLAYQVYSRTHAARREKGHEGLRPGDRGFDEALAELYAELAATPFYGEPPARTREP